ncbi:unnamed protein product [Meloidogyne enterolobii]|uniref:Uncharacterized protein n=1 Tax=Meloidogyne enterolobii TaxID=390850 RepID=A0ACB1B1S5_MELEN
MSINSHSLNSHPFLTLLLSKFGHNELPEGAAEKWALSERLANWLDCRDILSYLRDEFYIPKMGTLPNGYLINLKIIKNLNTKEVILKTKEGYSNKLIYYSPRV